MTTPKHSPVLPLRYEDTYDENVRCYGKPPKGYRWLKVGDPVSEKTLMVSWGSFFPYNKDWGSHPRDKVALNEWPAIEPVEKLVKAKPVPRPPTPLEQIKTLLSAHSEIAADVMRECIQVIADRK